MSLIPKTYAVKNHKLGINGAPIVGLAEEDITVEPMNAEEFTMQPGLDGKVDFAYKKNDGWTLTFSLKETSVSNSVLAGIRKASSVSPVFIPAAIAIIRLDRLVPDFSASACFIQGEPTTTIASDGIPAVSWTLLCTGVKLGGH